MFNKFRGLSAILVLMFTFSVQAALVINEVDYDQSGADTEEFVELYNSGPNAVDLTGYVVEFFNGSASQSIYNTDTLPNITLAAGSYFVICQNMATVANCDLLGAAIQNGAPDAIAIRDASSAIVDALSYEGNTTAPYTEGTGAGSDSTAAGIGLARTVNGYDTNDNSADFSQLPITPGTTNSAPTTVATISSSTDVLINGGSNGTATVTPSAGTPAYQYLWSDGQTTATAIGLVAGTYTVKVTDSLGASALDSVTITEPTVLTSTASVTDETSVGANDGTATVVAAGGVGPYMYLWSNGATTATTTGLMPGTYTVVVTDSNGATASPAAPIVIAAAAPPAIIPTLNQYMIMLLMLLVGLVAVRRVKA